MEKIEVNELSPGNYITNNGTVNDITSNGINVYIVKDVLSLLGSHVVVGSLHNLLGYEMKKVDNFEGILLTTGWLKMLGFEEKDNINGVIQKWCHSKHDNDFLLCSQSYVSLEAVPELQIKYVHRLQNIYTALTGDILCAVDV